MIRSALVAFAMLAMTVAPGWALTMTQTQGFVGTPNFDTTIQFDRFDPAKGVLQSVEWRFELSVEGGTLTVDNDGELPATVRVELGATGEASSPDVSMIDASLSAIFAGASKLAVSTGSEFELAGDNGDGMTFDPTLPDAATHGGGVATVSSSAFVNPSLVNEYVGTSMFDLDVTINQLLDFGGKGGVSGQFDPVTASVNLSLTYEYVPEPTGAAAGLFGLLSVVGLARRRS